MPQIPTFDPMEAMQACEKPFAFDEHAFIKKKGTEEIDSVYIAKDALRRRLTLIDPRWSSHQPELIGIHNNVVEKRGSMTFLGVTRSAVGTGIIQATKTWNNKTVPLEGYELDRQVSKALKTAASDLLPRLCLEWNIGTYLRPFPKDTVKTEAQFRTWLDERLKVWEQRYAGMRHWAANGKGTLFQALVKEYGLSWETVRTQLEPGRTLTGLRDITLTDVQAIARLGELKAQLRPVGGV